MRQVFFALLAILFSSTVFAQQAGSDIWLGKIDSAETDGQAIRVSNWEQVTDAPYYHSQPYFSQDGAYLYFTAADSEGQTDIHRYSIAGQATDNLTKSETSEYSPTPMPGARGLSGIWVDNEGTQWLQQWSFEGQRQRQLLEVEPIGYHVWLSDSDVLVFVLGDGEEPIHTLQKHNINADYESSVIDQHIGASLWAIPSQPNTFSYSKTENHQHWLMAYNARQGAVEALVELPTDIMYYAWDPKGLAVVGSSNGVLRAWDMQKGGEWFEYLDISTRCQKGISRLSFSEDRQYLAVVCNRA